MIIVVEWGKESMVTDEEEKLIMEYNRQGLIRQARKCGNHRNP